MTQAESWSFLFVANCVCWSNFFIVLRILPCFFDQGILVDHRIVNIRWPWRYSTRRTTVSSALTGEASRKGEKHKKKGTKNPLNKCTFGENSPLMQSYYVYNFFFDKGINSFQFRLLFLFHWIFRGWFTRLNCHNYSPSTFPHQFFTFNDFVTIPVFGCLPRTNFVVVPVLSIPLSSRNNQSYCIPYFLRLYVSSISTRTAFCQNGKRI